MRRRSFIDTHLRSLNLSYVLFYEEGEGEAGPRLVQQKQESE